MAVFPKVNKGVCVVYAIRLTHDPDFEYRYVGLTTNAPKRLPAHIDDSFNRKRSNVYDTPKSTWIRKHFGAVTFDVLEVVDDRALLGLTEMKWIHILRTRGHRLLNVTLGGDGTFGMVPSPETREKMSESHKGNRPSDATRLKMSQTRLNLGPVHTAEGKKKMSDSKMGTRNPMYGKTHSEEARKNISSKLRGVPKSESAKANMKEASKKTLPRAIHVRWHINRGISNPDCALCTVDSTGTLV